MREPFLNNLALPQRGRTSRILKGRAGGINEWKRQQYECETE